MYCTIYSRIIVKQGFSVIVAFCYNICLFKNPLITILKAFGCEDYVRENKLPQWKPPAAGQFLQLFLEKNSQFNAIWMTF